MKQSFFVFTPGWIGVALLLLRLSVAAFLFTVPLERLGQAAWATWALDGLALLIGLGLRTRIAAFAAGVVAISQMVIAGDLVLMPLSAHALDAIVLAMAGPGAYSLDSRLFGRRTLRLPH